MLAISVHTWTTAKNDVFKGLNVKPMGFPVVHTIHDVSFITSNNISLISFFLCKTYLYFLIMLYSISRPI